MLYSRLQNLFLCHFSNPRLSTVRFIAVFCGLLVHGLPLEFFFFSRSPGARHFKRLIEIKMLRFVLFFMFQKVGDSRECGSGRCAIVFVLTTCWRRYTRPVIDKSRDCFTAVVLIDTIKCCICDFRIV